MKDYPAAHSMDSTWFAVDADGNIAYFDTGEGGAVPESDFPLGGEAGGYDRKKSLEGSQLLARALRARAGADDRLAAILPPEEGELERLLGSIDYIEIEILLRSVGVWTYECPVQVAAPYVRVGTVPSPLRIDELDTATRSRFARARLPVQFAEARRIAPGEHVPVYAWGRYWIDLDGNPHRLSGGSDAELDHEGIDLEPPRFGPLDELETLEGEDFYTRLDALLEEARRDEGLASARQVRPGAIEWLRRLFSRGS